jgi:hypothetical protein
MILADRKEIDGLPWVGEGRLVPLKASAWLVLGDRQAKGERVGSKNIRKHANDVLPIYGSSRLTFASASTRELPRGA